MSHRHLSDQTDIGLVTDFLFEGGAESVVEVLARSYPDATIYTAIYDPDTLPHYPAIQQARDTGRLRTTLAHGLLKIGGLARPLSYYHFFWLYFLTSAFQRTKRHDVTIVSCCAQSKLVRIPRGSRVITYFHTPTRWLYPQLVTEGDLQAIPGALRLPLRMICKALRPLDRLGLRRLQKHHPVHLCNSSYIRDRLKEIYGIDARVIFPPVDVLRFEGITRQPEDFFLYHGRLTFQKRVDVAILGCLLAQRRLVISGQAASRELLRHLQGLVTESEARNPSLKGLVTFAGRTSDAELTDLLSRCAGLIFPPREDFGIAPVEAIASGVPVIAYGAGGALDYVKPGINGQFFAEQTPESLAAVLKDFDAATFDPATMAASLPDLSVARFQREMDEVVAMALSAPSRPR